MLTGPELGAAIEEARLKKRVTKRALARHFGVEPPSVQDWVKRGTINKAKLPELWSYFSDVVDLEHWGLSATGPGLQRARPQPATLAAAIIALGDLLQPLDDVARAQVAPLFAALAADPSRANDLAQRAAAVEVSAPKKAA